MRCASARLGCSNMADDGPYGRIIPARRVSSFVFHSRAIFFDNIHDLTCSRANIYKLHTIAPFPRDAWFFVCLLFKLREITAARRRARNAYIQFIWCSNYRVIKSIRAPHRDYNDRHRSSPPPPPPRFVGR